MSDEESNDEGLSAQSSLDLPYWPKQSLEANKASTTKDTQGKNVNITDGKELTQSQRMRKRHFRLNQNHQFLLLVDQLSESSLEKKRNRCLEMRILFERTIVTWAKPPTSSTTTSHSSKRTEGSGGLQLGTDSQQRKTKGFKSPAQPLRENLARKSRTSIALPTMGDRMFDTITPRSSCVYSKQLQPQFLGKGALGVPGSDRSSTTTSNITVDRNIHPRHPNDGSSKESPDNVTTTSDVIARVPICGIVAGGGASTIEHIYVSVTLNRCPMVIVRGSGGMAEVIAEVIDFMNFKNSLEENMISDEEVNLKIASIIHETRISSYLEKTGPTRTKKQYKKPTKGLIGSELKTNNEKEEPDAQKGPVIDYKAYAHQVELIREMVEEHAHLLSVFDSDDTDLDGYMISALLSSAGMDTPKNELNLDQLEIAIRLNRADIARTKIFLEGKRWKKGALNDFMFTVILNDQNDFVSLLLENGFNLEEFLSVHTLERLYTECLKKTDYKTGLLQQLWKRARIYKMEWVMLRDIGRIIKNLVGDFYHPLYLTKRFRNTVVTHGLNDSSDEEDMVEDVPKGSKKGGRTVKTIESSPDVTSASTLPEEEEADITSSFRNKLRAHSFDADIPNSLDSDLVTNSSPRPPVKPKQDATKNVKPKQQIYKPIISEHGVTNDDRQPLLKHSGEAEQDDEDELTLRGSSDHSSDESSDVTVVEDTRLRPKTRDASAGQQPLRSKTTSTPAFRYRPPNGRCYIVRPITAFQLGYQPYVRKSPPVPKNGLLAFGSAIYPQSNSSRSQSVGKYRVIDYTHQSDDQRITAPKAQMENTRNLKIQSSSRSKGTDNKADSGNASDQNGKLAPTVPIKPNPAILVVKVYTPTHDGISKLEGPRRQKGHAVFAADTQQSSKRRARSLGRVQTETHLSVLGNRAKFGDGARRVTHSILHPLTDPERTQLKLKETERRARERRKEKDRKFRHRVAQGKFTIMERLTGKAKEQNFSHTVTVTFERPAREIMIMCMLLGKLTMTQVFWSHEKEPIAAALIGSILFGELASKSDDVTCKEEYEEAARTFEEKAEEVLDECYQEDRLRTQLLLCRKLEFYGGSSVIRLAARGRCIRFMAHPCCQDLLSGVWMGGLSPKYTWIQFLTGIIIGLTCPLLLPQVMKYTTAIGEDTNGVDQAFGSDSSFSEYISDGWNQLDCLAIGLFSIGFALRIQAYGHIQQIGEKALLTVQLGVDGNQTDPTVMPLYHVAGNFTQFVHDIYWANALETENQSAKSTAMVYNVTANDNTTINSTLTRKSGLKSLYDVVTRSYFQMLGEFRVDELEGESRSLQCNPALEKKLTKWEHMIGSRRTRADGEGAGARKWTGGGTRGEGHAIILRTVGGGTSGAAAATTKGLGRDTAVGRGGGVDASSLLQGIGPIFGPETMFIEDRFVELGNQLGRFVTMEEKLSKIVQTANGLVKALGQVTQQQKQVINSLHPKDGRRLVGRGQKLDPSSRKNLIIEAVSNAVAGLSSHCSDIEEKIEEKIRIEKQCVKAVLTRSNADDVEPDVVLQASQSGPPSRGPRAASLTGRILERVLLSHRLWRIVPFNFEIYPGIRMNVPIEMLNWKVPYKEYCPFKITEDRLAIPYPGMDDGPEVIPQQLPYNEYDSQRGVSRMTCRGHVRVYRKTPGMKPAIDDATNLIGLPLNPTGRSGLRDKGLLPHWGPNHAITIALTRPHPDGLMQAGLPVIQVAALFRNQNFCLPWVYAGFLHDHLNADHAWIETVFLNIHQNNEEPLRAELLEAFLEDDKSERVVWLNICHQLGMRSSHDELLRQLAIHRKAFFHEELVGNDYA
ncbi:uncharacterized protein DEA37_0004076 [Paragonimus westermani]|uniref:Uncharacterized protein n=2 Tax=Paragonimus westermani TaxID=34504 RepID=A0A5J4NJB2_9TREM|nr:uncharacterized protein DEA37_0004076 [Paragonimus westermani]